VPRKRSGDRSKLHVTFKEGYAAPGRTLGMQPTLLIFTKTSALLARTVGRVEIIGYSDTESKMAPVIVVRIETHPGCAWQPRLTRRAWCLAPIVMQAQSAADAEMLSEIFAIRGHANAGASFIALDVTYTHGVLTTAGAYTFYY